MKNSQSLFERAQKIIPGGVNSPVRAFRSVGGTPFFTAKASGSCLTTVDDKELIDYVCTWGPAIHGHDHPKIREAISDALSKDLKKRGFKFVGSTVIYAHMQATGMVNDHIEDCFRYSEV